MQYVSGDTVVLLIGASRLFPFHVALFPWIHIGLYIVGKIKFKSMNRVGQILNNHFNQTNTQWRRRCKIMITQKTRALLVVVLKLTQLKRANTLSTNPSIGGEGRVCTIAK